MALFLAALPACGNGADPGSGPEDDPGERLTSIGYLWSPLEWSPDGKEIYLVGGSYAPDGKRDQLLAVDAQTGGLRVLAGCAASNNPLAATAAGVGFIATCDGASTALHLIRDGRDTVLAPGARWVARTPDRARLIYGTAEEPPCEPCYPITVIDVATLHSQLVPTTGQPPWWEPVSGAISPDGTELLTTPGGSPAQFARLTLATGTWSQTVQEDWNARAVLGWNAAGVWIMLGISGEELGEAFTGTVATQLPRDETVISHEWTSGFMAPNGGSIALWSTGCTRLSPGEGSCEAARYTLWSHNLTTHSTTFVARGSADYDRDRPFGQGAYSPDGLKIAYIMNGDIYTRASP
jgi:hypothetical protein